MSDTVSLHLLWRFAIALFIGALVGIDREKKRGAENGRDIAGLRTFILFALTGALAAELSQRLASAWLFAVGGLLVGAIVTAGYAVFARVQASYGLTSEMAAFVVYLLGGVAIVGDPALAVALAIATAAVLAFKEPLHEIVTKIGRDDLYATLTLLICTFIVLPVLPNRAVDPWGALNPYTMWWLVILISGLSLIGYVATRMLGEGRGVPLTGLFGGLVSSTAVTLSFARRSREAGATATTDALAAGILLAWAVMFGRILIEVAVVSRALVAPIAVPMACVGAVTLAAAALLLWHGRRAGVRGGADAEAVPLENPFSLASAIRFALLFAAVLLVVKLVETYLPGRGLYAVAALAGLTDVDAITLSVAGAAAEGTVDADMAVAAIVIAALSNTLVKTGFVVAIGTAALKRRLLAAVGLLVGGAAASLFFS